MTTENKLEVHFLNVDHGDCTVIRHPGDNEYPHGRVSVIDINDWKDRNESVAGLQYYLRRFLNSETQISDEDYARKYLNDPVKYLQNEVLRRNEEVWRFISTHPDMDHLSGIERLGTEVGFKILWDTFHNKSLSYNDEWPTRFDPEDWMYYQSIRDEETDHRNIHPTRGTNVSHWGEDNIEILHPSPAFVMQKNQEASGKSNPDYNNLSYVLKVNTEAGSVLLPGDVKEEGWKDVLEYCKDDLSDVRVLKAPHHGRQSSFYEPAVEAIDPDYVIISVGKKPDTDAHSDYRRVCADSTEIFSTRQHGRVKVTVEDGSLNVDLEVSDGIFTPKNW
jgi:competence protein ComEC